MKVQLFPNCNKVQIIVLFTDEAHEAYFHWAHVPRAHVPQWEKAPCTVPRESPRVATETHTAKKKRENQKILLKVHGETELYDII